MIDAFLGLSSVYFLNISCHVLSLHISLIRENGLHKSLSINFSPIQRLVSSLRIYISKITMSRPEYILCTHISYVYPSFPLHVYVYLNKFPAWKHHVLNILNSLHEKLHILSYQIPCMHVTSLNFSKNHIIISQIFCMPLLPKISAWKNNIIISKYPCLRIISPFSTPFSACK